MVSHLRTPILNCFTYLLWAYLLTDPEFSCLAMLAKPYLVSGPTYLPRIPNQFHCMSTGFFIETWYVKSRFTTF